MSVGECSRWLQVAYGKKIIVIKRWFLEELMTVIFKTGEYQGCYERYTADCTKGAIVTQRKCPGKAAQVTEMCLSGTCEESVLTKTVETGQVYDVAVPGHTEVILET